MEAMREKACALIDGWRQEMLLFWEKLVNMESGSLSKEDVDKVAVFLKEGADSFGGQADILEFPESGNSVVAVFGQPTDKAPICFLGHFDTVFPHGTVQDRPFRIEDGKAYGPGVLDMKGGVTIQLFAARALRAAGYTDRQIKVVLAGDEEILHVNSSMAKVFEEQSRGSLAAFNFETGDVSDAFVVGRKGSFSYEMAVNGVSVHAGREPQNGRSAIRELAYKVIDIDALSDFDAGISVNVCTIKGGFAKNAIPDHAKIAIDLRVMRNDQLASMDQKLRAIAEKTYIEGTTTSLRTLGGMGPMEKKKGNEVLYDFVRATAEKMGQRASEAIISGGASDSAYSVLAGVPTIDQMGVRGQWNHSDREYALVESLFERAKLAVACVLNIDEFERQLKQ